MEKGFLVWVKNPAVREPTQDDLWIPGVVVDQVLHFLVDIRNLLTDIPHWIALFIL